MGVYGILIISATYSLCSDSAIITWDAAVVLWDAILFLLASDWLLESRGFLQGYKTTGPVLCIAPYNRR